MIDTSRVDRWRRDGESMWQAAISGCNAGPTWAIVLLAMMLVGCIGMHESPDFERHRFSQLSEPFERKDILYFDVMFGPNFPDDDAVAEAKRMEWLASWLEQRKMCLAGHEIHQRRPFGMLEHNPARYDLRYEVKCKAQPGV